MNNNPLDAFPYLQQMTQQFRQMFGDDFVQNLMKSMQMPMGSSGGMPGAGMPGAGTQGPMQSGPQSRFGSHSRTTSDDATQTGQGNPMANMGAWPNWMGQWNPMAGGGPTGGDNPTSFPPVDIYETRHELRLVAEIPGLERASDVRLSVFPDRIILKGERKRSSGRGAEGNLIQSERSTGAFERSVVLPTRVRKQHARASYAHGLLEVHLLKENRTTDPDGNIVDIDFL